MKTYKIFTSAILMAGALMVSSCSDDFLTSTPTESQQSGAPATESAILSNLGAAYQILLFDSYANGNYNAVLLMSDLRSDDIWKGGGSASDQQQLYNLSQFSSTSNLTLDGLWSIYYSGLARCNNVIMACANPVSVPEAKLKQYNAEAHFLRAYYTHLLWKFWGNIPYFEEPLDAPYMTKQLTADEVYAKIMADLDIACADGALSMATTGNDLGRVNRAAALMLRARVVMYQKDNSKYAQVTKDMAEIINSKKYKLMKDFAGMWTDSGEFCEESIFETNQTPLGKTWSASWQGYGTNLPAFISPNNLSAGSKTGDFKGGWGFGPVRESTYTMFEDGDIRRDGSINHFDASQYTPRFQDTGYFQAKYAARVGYNPQGDVDLNYCNNLRIFRYAETLLNYVELVKMDGQAEVDGVTAQDCFNLIRQRAFGSETAPDEEMTTANIKLERRREFVGEGMRFWDLVRWGDAPSVLTENVPAFSSVRTYNDWMKYLPIPQSEIDKTAGTEFELKQNGNWK